MKWTFENVPDELKQHPQWVCWKWEQRGDTWTKPPINPKTGRKASNQNPSDWGDFETADKCYQSHNGTYGGVGFVFTSDDPFCGIDLDDVRDPATGEIDPRAEDIINGLNTYCEVSPSQTGFKAICKGKLPGGGRKVKDIWKNSPASVEAYDQGRYFCVTGDVVNVVSQQIEDRQDEVTKLYRWLDSRKVKNDQQPVQQQTTGGTWDGNVDHLNVPYSVKALIRNGEQEGRRSEAIFSVLCSLVGASYSDEIIFQVFNNHPIGAKYREKGHGAHKWLSDEIGRARAKAVAVSYTHLRAHET